MTTPLRILWLHSDRNGCGTYRTYIPGLTLESRGYDNNYLLHAGVPRNGSTTDHDGNDLLANIDLVVFQRAFGDVFIEWMKACKQRKIATVVEVDDDLFNVPRTNPAASVWRHKEAQDRVRRQAQMADHVLVSTVPLGRVMSEECDIPHSKITVAYNHLHPAVWGDHGDQTYPNTDGSVVIGWQGSMTHDTDFREALPALKTIADMYPQVVFRFFGAVPLTLQGVIAEQRFQWVRGVAFDRYPATLRYLNFDIGLAPVTNCKFNQSKSHLKWMEYAVLRVPCVASRVYPYENAISHGVTGLLASNTAEWVGALSQLVDDVEYRRRIGQSAYDDVQTSWQPGNHIVAWERAFEIAMLKVR